MELNDAKVLGALCLTQDADPMPLAEVARRTGIPERTVAESLRTLDYAGFVQERCPGLKGSPWQITSTGATVMRHRPNREHIQSRGGEEVTPGPDGNSSAFPGEDPRDDNLLPVKRPALGIFRVKYED